MSFKLLYNFHVNTMYQHCCKMAKMVKRGGKKGQGVDQMGATLIHRSEPDACRRGLRNKQKQTQIVFQMGTP
jgi:hypothetical protein